MQPLWSGSSLSSVCAGNALCPLRTLKSWIAFIALVSLRSYRSLHTGSRHVELFIGTGGGDVIGIFGELQISEYGRVAVLRSEGQRLKGRVSNYRRRRRFSACSFTLCSLKLYLVTKELANKERQAAFIDNT